MSKAKLSPEQTVPRLELCAAVLAVELAEFITSEIDVPLDDTTYFTDGKVVLGYIYNETRRFYVYVSNRVLQIRKSSHPNQWKYVHTDISRQFHKGSTTETLSCKGWHYCSSAPTVEELLCAEKTIVKAVQQEKYAQEYKSLEKGDKLSKKSLLKGLDPFIDADGLLRVGGRLTEAQIELDVKKPLIIPGKHHIATLLVKHHHEKVRHQGRHYTEGAVRAAGYWIVGGKRRVCSVIHECVTCRRLRREPQTQKMADLPTDCVSTDPPFTNVGLDVFGPWSVAARRTRGGHAQSKRWAVIFTCMSVRAVHIELIESLDTSSFINALQRFIAI